MRTVPVNHSAGPLPEGCEPFRLMSIFGFFLEEKSSVPTQTEWDVLCLCTHYRHSVMRTDRIIIEDDCIILQSLQMAVGETGREGSDGRN